MSTPPWKAISRDGVTRTVIDAGGMAVADVHTGDASLIAAAPDLLAACKAFLHASNERRYSAKETLEAREMMEMAVAKAEGK